MWRFVSLLTFGTKKKAKFRAIFGKIGLAIGAVVDTKRKCFLKSGTKRYALPIDLPGFQPTRLLFHDKAKFHDKRAVILLICEPGSAILPEEWKFPEVRTLTVVFKKSRSF